MRVARSSAEDTFVTFVENRVVVNEAQILLEAAANGAFTADGALTTCDRTTTRDRAGASGARTPFTRRSALALSDAARQQRARER